MILNEQQQLREAIVANRRMLKLLDQQIEELAQLEPGVSLGLAEPDRHQPFSYVVEGVDQKAGIVVQQPVAGPIDERVFAPQPPVGFQNPFYGYIRIQSDAAFVATRAFACVRSGTVEIPPLPNFPDGLPASDRHLDAPTADNIWGISFRIYDEAAARWVLLANNRQRVQQDAAVPAPLFGQLALSSPGGLDLPTECVFPRNGLLRVEAYVQRFNQSVSGPPPTIEYTPPFLKRIYFVLRGYKVFGG